MLLESHINYILSINDCADILSVQFSDVVEGDENDTFTREITRRSELSILCLILIPDGDCCSDLLEKDFVIEETNNDRQHEA
jgi:hypothetical protein